ncbi:MULTISPECIES: hypothetical protein [unclassified Mesorhizobium]|uniref:hypothetical protein n=1 Tax=unclassified Mesorhizobium TaxID=325217 RepID=UPI000FDB3923|nr:MULTISPECIES: hypothetical protein [unclassified Mesorhizobium]TGQ31480.1 hypothetical protein EN859_030120 [Mesorhizobium sp. M00.F.Ca.ET.216.01.1.1]TIS55554.1 MAG: hypothetical protein E5W91_21950 [Mesorhizobium sp.]TIS87850.1 MAG: hypothetical protein E5W89_22985 [Mesorhizobium sp.]TJW06426.1 MAG: hypothetical protein E5W82_27735 [Mesorhizobium sp.]TJW44834.1 MAG: hypothetical protein E5W83_13225 [Mesorhizobium sp.]
MSVFKSISAKATITCDDSQPGMGSGRPRLFALFAELSTGNLLMPAGSEMLAFCECSDCAMSSDMLDFHHQDAKP